MSVFNSQMQSALFNTKDRPKDKGEWFLEGKPFLKHNGSSRDLSNLVRNFITPSFGSRMTHGKTAPWISAYIYHHPREIWRSIKRCNLTELFKTFFSCSICHLEMSRLAQRFRMTVNNWFDRWALDFEGNAERILQSIKAAKAAGCSWVRSPL